MLVIQVEYLLGRAVATEHNRYQVPEWPPHPARLFYALVAAHHECSPPGQAGPLEREALLWLETLPPPTVFAPEAVVRGSTDRRDPDQPTTHYVPVNDARGDEEDGLPEKRGRQARSFPSVTPDRPQLAFVYPDATPDERTRAALTGLLARVTYLGHSSSLVNVRLQEDLPVDTPAWQPDTQRGTELLRVPAEGLLEALEAVFARTYASVPQEESTPAGKGKRTRVPELPPMAPRGQLPAAAWPYRRPGAEDVTPVPGGSLQNMVVFRRADGPRFPLEAFPNVAEALRGAALAAAETPHTLLSGHAPDGAPLQLPHVAYVPLPDVGHEHARGHLLGIAALLPRGLEGTERREVLRILASLEKLTFGPAGCWELERLVGVADQEGLRPATWSRPARRWVTVTPLVLDRFPKDKDLYGEEAEEIAARACQHAGFPRPVGVVLAQTSLALGVPPARAFPALVRKDGARRVHVHAVLTFSEPVAGPMLVGAGRYLGYGLCRPMGGKGTP